MFTSRLPLILADMVYRHLDTGEAMAPGFLERGVMYHIVDHTDGRIHEWAAVNDKGVECAWLQLYESSYVELETQKST